MAEAGLLPRLLELLTHRDEVRAEFCSLLSLDAVVLAMGSDGVTAAVAACVCAWAACRGECKQTEQMYKSSMAFHFEREHRAAP